jgi:hypothetical protein
MAPFDATPNLGEMQRLIIIRAVLARAKGKSAAGIGQGNVTSIFAWARSLAASDSRSSSA